MDDDTAVKVAENEATFRGANEEISEAAAELEFRDPIPFLCECGDGRCRQILELPRAQYESVRAEPTHFFVVPGHESVAGRAGRVVNRHSDHVVVEKTGVAGEVAAKLDQRAPAE